MESLNLIFYNFESFGFFDAIFIVVIKRMSSIILLINIFLSRLKSLQENYYMYKLHIRQFKIIITGGRRETNKIKFNALNTA